MKYNVYCDESCHLEHDGINKMVMGCTWVPHQEVKSMHRSIMEIKRRHGFRCEAKWKKVSPGKAAMYEELLRFFFSNDYLNFRCVVVSDKNKLDHQAFNAGSHDAFYYKMFYQVLQTVVDASNSYNIYMDIKDTQSSSRIMILRDVLRRQYADPDGRVISRIQQIRSHETGILQICDMLIGAVAYRNRDLKTSAAKGRLVEIVEGLSRQKLNVTSARDINKLNIFIFEPQEIR